jgi:hypothetical protein
MRLIGVCVMVAGFIMCGVGWQLDGRHGQEIWDSGVLFMVGELVIVAGVAIIAG